MWPSYAQAARRDVVIEQSKRSGGKCLEMERNHVGPISQDIEKETSATGTYKLNDAGTRSAIGQRWRYTHYGR